MGKKQKGKMEDEAFVFGVTARHNRNREEMFRDFHEAHPEIWDAFSRLSALIYAKGFRRYSADIIIHLIRWEYDKQFGPGSKEVPKVNDWYTSYYAELFRISDPKYGSFFPKKKRRKQE